MKISRRRFFKRSSATGTALLLGTLVPREVDASRSQNPKWYAWLDRQEREVRQNFAPVTYFRATIYRDQVRNERAEFDFIGRGGRKIATIRGYTISIKRF